jgi:Protein of unknown function (DUF1573)
MMSLILLLVIAWGCAHTAIASEVMIGTPALEVPEWYFDFGEVKEGTVYLHAFVIRNKGTGVLEIKKVQPGCGTSVVSFDKAIPPGAEGKIIIKIHPRQCQSGDRKVSLVLTNDPQTPRFTLVVQGKLKEG